MSDLVNNILASCEAYKNSIAISGGESQVTYGQLANQIDTWKGLFEKRGNPQRIGFSLANSPQYVAALYGAIAAGGTPFLMDPGMPEESKKVLVETLGLDLIVSATKSNPEWFKQKQEVGEGFEFSVQANAATEYEIKNDTALCRFTSGTSGVPKCLEFSHNAVLQAARTWADAHQYNSKDTVLCLAAFFNGLAFNTSFSSVFLSGATLLLYPGLPAAPMVVRYASENSATRLVAFPIFYQQAATLTSVSLRSSGVTYAYSAASRLQDKTRIAFQEAHGLSIVDYYGLAEVGPVTYEPNGQALIGTGIALPGCDIRIRDGILQVKTPYRASSYLNHPGKLEARIDEDGFLTTEDYARIEDGRLFMTGRADGIINVAGQKFDPSDTIEALRMIPGLKDAFVFGADAGDGTHDVCAVVSCTIEMQQVEIRKMLTDKLEAYKIPSQILVVDEIPRNGAGKPYTSEIRKLFKAKE